MIRKKILLTFVLSLLLHFPAQGQEAQFTDEIGRMVSIPHPPKRIVSMAPSITEILFTLGLDEEIVGVTDFCNYPEAALTKQRIGGFVNPSIEKIVSLKPDLILGIRDGNRMDTIQRLTIWVSPSMSSIQRVLTESLKQSRIWEILFEGGKNQQKSHGG